VSNRIPLGAGLALLLVTSPATADEPAPPSPAQAEFFEAKVRPILAGRCASCHGPEKQKAGLRLDSPEAMRSGGDSGPAIEPGNPEESLLIEAVRYEGATQMPPDGKLDEAEITALVEWVKMGAPWPRPAAEPRPTPSAAAPAGITDEERNFWAFRPVADPPIPPVNHPGWPKASIDHFLLARLEQEGLRPAPSADKRVLIRRATFDLTGLPPAPEEIDAFLADDSPEAFAKVIDRLLASPRYGERWARHWLDIARYGEDQAHTFKPQLYPNGYRYRDWVVKALNEDMPYDRFATEQVAGDLLDGPGLRERMPALGFFACGPVYYGDPKKLDQYDDRIDTLGRGFLGLTVACARCHDHKYDPIPTQDYYALAGVFASSTYQEAPLAPPEEVAAFDLAKKAQDEQDRVIATFLDDQADRLVAARAAESARYLVAAWKVRQRDAEASKGAIEAVARDDKLDDGRLGRWVAFLADAKPDEHPPLARWLEACGRASDAQGEVEGAARDAQAAILALLERRSASPVEGKAGEEKPDGDPKEDDPKGPAKLSKQERESLDVLTGDRGPLGIPKKRLEAAMADDARSQLKGMREKLDRLKKEAPPMYAMAHALKDGTPTNARILPRGNPDNPGPEAPRHFLTILGGAPLAQGSGRLELAKAIASPANPLTARVMVNRIWQHHFGRGLVATPSNFGKLGERPSHPELLDHLASRFVASGWSIKAMHRLILNSSAYQQSGRPDARAIEVDPENRLLWRMNRQRLEIEPWRDAVLAVSGRLDLATGGPSTKLDDPENRRRTLYAAVSRHNLDPLLRLFDFPDPNITSAERTRTTVPLQQLIVLNDDFLVASARALASRLEAEAGGDDAAKVRRAYALLFGRPPTGRELDLGLGYLKAADPAGPTNDLPRWDRYAQALLGTNEFLFVD
jgi:mono/diheme cytochrome c family protein